MGFIKHKVSMLTPAFFFFNFSLHANVLFLLFSGRGGEIRGNHYEVFWILSIHSWKGINFLTTTCPGYPLTPSPSDEILFSAWHLLYSAGVQLRDSEKYPVKYIFNISSSYLWPYFIKINRYFSHSLLWTWFKGNVPVQNKKSII